MPTKKQVEISAEERLAAAQTDIIFGVRLIEALETLLHQNEVDGDVTFAQLDAALIRLRAAEKKLYD